MKVPKNMEEIPYFNNKKESLKRALIH